MPPRKTSPPLRKQRALNQVLKLKRDDPAILMHKRSPCAMTHLSTEKERSIAKETDIHDDQVSVRHQMRPHLAPKQVSSLSIRETIAIVRGIILKPQEQEVIVDGTGPVIRLMRKQHEFVVPTIEVDILRRQKRAGCIRILNREVAGRKRCSSRTLHSHV
jgi:hypothetical protein